MLHALRPCAFLQTTLRTGSGRGRARTETATASSSALCALLQLPSTSWCTEAGAGNTRGGTELIERLVAVSRACGTRVEEFSLWMADVAAMQFAGSNRVR